MSTPLEDALWRQLVNSGIDLPEREHRFHPTRRWRFDFAWVSSKVACEVDGGIFVYGGHNRGGQILKDMEKRNEATCLGWRVLRIGKQHIESGQALGWIERALGGQG